LTVEGEGGESLNLRNALLFILVVVSICSIGVLFYQKHAYENWKMAEVARCKELYGPTVPSTGITWEEWLEFAPFEQSSFVQPVIVIGVALTVCWVASIIVLARRHKKLAATSIASLAVLVTAYLTLPAAANPTAMLPYPCHVDVLVASDNWFNDGSIPVIGIGYKQLAEFSMEDLTTYFRDTFYIDIHWHAWLTFDGDYSRNFIIDVLHDAEKQVGWTPWNKQYDGETIELLAVFTGQLGDVLGISLPWVRAFLCRADINLRSILLHEFGHQLGLVSSQSGHCDNTCVMHKPPTQDYFCDSCRLTVSSNCQCLFHPPPSVPPPPPNWHADKTAWEYWNADCMGEGYIRIIKTETTCAPLINGAVVVSTSVGYFDESHKLIGERHCRIVM